MSELSVNRLCVEVHGRGTPVLMLHGLGGTSNTFEPLMSAVSGFRALRPDLPGSGRSALPGGTLSLDGMVRALLSLCATLELPPAHLVGHSMGTLVCQHLAARAPELVLSLTLFGALHAPAEPARAALRERAATARGEGMQPVAEAIVGASLSASSRAGRPLAAAFVRESLLRQPPAGYAASCEALAGAEAAELDQIRCPCLLVTGADDPVTPPQMAQHLEDRIKRARLRLLPGIGHWTPIEAPVECARLLREFLHRDAAS